ncbi:hypothetical protein OROGR_005917 [Orobanche gracilis]
MSRNSRNWINRMVSEPYYLLHFLAFFSYIPLRCSAAHVLCPLRSTHLLRREIQALLAFCVLAAVKFGGYAAGTWVRCDTRWIHILFALWQIRAFKKRIRVSDSTIHDSDTWVVKSESWQAFVADTLFFAKIFLAAIALIIDYHLALFYAATFVVIYIITQQPAHGGLGTRMITWFPSNSFFSLLRLLGYNKSIDTAPVGNVAY